MNAKPFNLRQVRLLDGLFKDAMEHDGDYLLRLDTDRLLYSFRVTAGLPTTATAYGGWEAPEVELRGHFVGHYLSACSLMYASTSDERFKERAEAIVTGFAECQAALPAQGYHAGYLSAFPESFFDRVEQRISVWAPYYTLHKIMAGLLDAYLHCANSQALAVLERLAAWVKFRVDNLSREQMQITLLMEFGGMNEVFANLYGVTQNPDHLRLSFAFNDDIILKPLENHDDQLDRQHANTQIPKLIGLARQYELTDESPLREAAQFFWERVAFHRSYAIGGNSDDELFFPVECFEEHLSPVSAETCNTHNMLKLTRHIFGWEPSAAVMDFYERALFNHILGSQDTDSGMMMYFVSLKPGHFKVYNSLENSFWCCTGTGTESHAKYGDTIYFHSDDTLFVNLFIASELTWAEKGVVLRQETQFPEADSTHLTIGCEQPTQLKLKIRYPAWASTIQLQINGETESVAAQPGSYITLSREWQNGDRIDIHLPMQLHTEALPSSEMIALLYGPIVLAGALGTADMPDVYLEDTFTRSTPINSTPAPPVPPLHGRPESIFSHVEPVEGQPLSFRLNGSTSAQAIELMPFYRLHRQRYTVYWHTSEAD